MTLKAPFPWFGGKSRAAHLVWPRIGPGVTNYVEPFAGSLAILLARPADPKTETVNDKDAFISNFWRALQSDPEAVAFHADWPVSEADLHARHAWLRGLGDFRSRVLRDPHYHSAKVAGWWVWGISQWIGGGWCKSNEERRHEMKGFRGVNARRIHLGRPYEIHAKRPNIKRGGNGVVRTHIPDLYGRDGATGKGVHASGRRQALKDWMGALSHRLRGVRVCCGDWQRVLGKSPTEYVGTTAVVLDPPYDVSMRAPGIYNEEDTGGLSADVREWAIEKGESPKYRIVLCGYEGEHEMPDGWDCVAWKAQGGYGNEGKEKNANRAKERIWFSPHCLKPEEELFAL